MIFSYEYVMVSSLDLSSAFNVVNIGLLVKRLIIVGLPEDLIHLIKIWLDQRLDYMSVDECNLVLFNGRGARLGHGPALFAIFNFCVYSNWHSALLNQVTSRMNSFRTWKSLCRQSLAGWENRALNKEKTHLCFFFNNDTAPVNINLGESTIHSKSEINVFGVVSD